MNTHYMSRWVDLKGNRVEFGNVVMGFSGTPYVYRCPSEDQAKAFAAFCEKRDPQNENLPIAVSPDVEASFGAVLEKE